MGLALMIFMMLPATAISARLRLASTSLAVGRVQRHRFQMFAPAPEPQAPRPVRLGMSTLLWPFATHWAVQIGDTWFEVPGITKQDTNSKMDIKSSNGVRSFKGADVSRFGLVGETSKRDEEIYDWIDAWTAANPTYSFSADNCQKFARELIAWLTNGKHKPLPLMDAGVGGNRAVGPRAWSGAERGASYAGATVANMQGHRGLLNGALDGPNASAAAMCSRQGFGAFGEAELFRAEAGFGPVRLAAHANINTCVGYRNKGLELLVGGAGLKVGLNGFSVSLPFLTVGIGRRV